MGHKTLTQWSLLNASIVAVGEFLNRTARLDEFLIVGVRDYSGRHSELVSGCVSQGIEGRNPSSPGSSMEIYQRTGQILLHMIVILQL